MKLRTQIAMGIGVSLAVWAFAPAASAFTLMASGLQGWDGRELQFRLNAANCPPQVYDALSAAFALWNSVPGAYLKLSRGADSSQGAAVMKARSATDAPLIVCDDAFGSNAWNAGASSNVVPAIGMIFNANPIRRGGLVLNVESGAGADVSTYSAGRLAIVLAHEIGHVLGLGHSGDPAALMYYNATYKQTLSLSDDDVDGLVYLYGRDEILRGDPLFGSCGLASAGGDPPSGASLALIAALLCAPLALAWRARGRAPRAPPRRRQRLNGDFSRA